MTSRRTVRYFCREHSPSEKDILFYFQTYLSAVEAKRASGGIIAALLFYIDVIRREYAGHPSFNHIRPRKTIKIFIQSIYKYQIMPKSPKCPRISSSPHPDRIL